MQFNENLFYKSVNKALLQILLLRQLLLQLHQNPLGMKMNLSLEAKAQPTLDERLNPATFPDLK